MADRRKVVEWFEFDYMPRVGAYRKDCKMGCDACMAKHDGGNYCDIDMLDKILALLKEQEAVPVRQREVMHMLLWCCGSCGVAITDGDKFCRMCGRQVKWE